MDIPGTPPKGSNPPSPVNNSESRGATLNRSLPHPVPLESLKLETGQRYAAVVLGKATGDPLATRSDPAATAQYLVEIKGKTLLVSSTKPLATEQRILLELIDTRPMQLRVLPDTTLRTNTPTAGEPRLSNTEINTLLRALTPIMAKQSSLQQGLVQLEAWQQNAPRDTGQQTLLLLTRALLESRALNVAQLLARPPHSSGNQTAQPPASHEGPSSFSGAGSNKVSSNNATASAPPASPAARDTTPVAQSLREALQHSGVFLEQRLTHALRAAVDAPGQRETSPPTTAQSPTSHALQEAVKELLSRNKMTTTEALTSLLNNLRTTQSSNPEARNRTDQAAPSLRQSGPLHTLQSWLNGKAGTLPGSDTTSPAAQISGAPPSARATAAANLLHNDLKGALVQLVSALKATELGEQEAKKVHPFTQADLLKNPFDFPHPAQQGINKASALMSDEPLSTGQMLRLLASLLNRLQFNQLNSLYQSHTNSADNQVQQSWFFELPLLHEQQPMQALNLRIDKKHEAEQQARKNPKQAIQWQITLSFDLDQLGPLYIQVKLTPPSISSVVWADHASTLALIERERAQLRTRLEDLGLEVGDIHCQRGRPNQDATKLAHQLVDIKA